MKIYTVLLVVFATVGGCSGPPEDAAYEESLAQTATPAPSASHVPRVRTPEPILDRSVCLGQDEQGVAEAKLTDQVRDLLKMTTAASSTIALFLRANSVTEATCVASLLREMGDERAYSLQKSVFGIVARDRIADVAHLNALNRVDLQLAASTTPPP